MDDGYRFNKDYYKVSKIFYTSIENIYNFETLRNFVKKYPRIFEYHIAGSKVLQKTLDTLKDSKTT